MAYIKNTWVDQDVERPKTYEVTNNQDGSITLTDSFGLVTELGTPVNAVNMNHIEDGIYTNDTNIGDLTDLTTTAKTDLVSAINEIAGQSDKANTDLSNLTSTGKTKVVTLAHELDFTNTIGVSTSAATSWTEYTAPSDGILFVDADGSNTTLEARIMYDGTAYTIGSYVRNANTNGTYFPMVQGQKVKYLCNGGSNQYTRFVPYKKS